MIDSYTKKPIYLDHNATTPVDPDVPQGDDALPDGGIREPVQRLFIRPAGP